MAYRVKVVGENDALCLRLAMQIMQTEGDDLLCFQV